MRRLHSSASCCSRAVMLPVVCHGRPGLCPKNGPKSADIALIWPNLGRFRAKSGRNCPTRGESGRASQDLVEAAPIGPPNLAESGRTRSKSLRLGRARTNFETNG